MNHLETIVKRFEQPDEVRECEKGRLELVTSPMTQVAAEDAR
jgi:hypothetical protein